MKLMRMILPIWMALFVLLAPVAGAQTAGPIVAVEAVGMTVSDMDRAVEFYSRVLTFEKVSDVEVVGEPFELLQGVFGVRMRVVRMQLGEEQIELTDVVHLAGRGEPAGRLARVLGRLHRARPGRPRHADRGAMIPRGATCRAHRHQAKGSGWHPEGGSDLPWSGRGQCRMSAAL